MSFCRISFLCLLLSLKLNAFECTIGGDCSKEMLWLQNNWGENGKEIVIGTKKITLSEYPEAYNPSLLKHEDGYLLTFRNSPDMDKQPWLSHIGVVKLNDNFEVISTPQLLDVRFENASIPSQAEDARIFYYQSKIYLIFNDCTEAFPLLKGDSRRDMYLAELKETNGLFTITKPIKLVHQTNYKKQKIEKNWSPFVSDDMLFLSYSLDPHEVLYPNFKTGICYPLASSTTYLAWKFGAMRSGIPAQEINGEFLSFFHAAQKMTSLISEGYEIWHYCMGAYTFSNQLPFEMTKISREPLSGKNFYSSSHRWKVVLYPGSFVRENNTIYLPYGKNDVEMWVAKLNLQALMDSLLPVTVFADTLFEPK